LSEVPLHPLGVPKTGPWAHDLSRELEFDRRLKSALSRFGTASSAFGAEKKRETKL